MKNLFIILFLLGFSFNAFASNYNKIEIGDKSSLHSSILNEDRHYWVYLPEQYNRSKKYPVIYLLDGDEFFHTTSGVLRHMTSMGLLPEMILVGILNTDRIRDFTPSIPKFNSKGEIETSFPTSGGSKKFLKFIKHELMPAIKSKYSTEDYNMLVGHSLGGLFSLSALLDEPDLFQSVISMDPSLWWDQHWLNKELQRKLENKPSSNTSLFMAAANNPDSKGLPTRTMIGPQEDFYNNISKWNSDNFRTNFKYFPDESHGSVPLIGLFKGISFIFEDYQVSSRKFIDDPKLLANHYDAWSKKLGYRLDPPESLINQIAYELLGQNKLKESIDLFKLNVDKYPLSANVYDSLGEAYWKSGKLDLSIKNYEKVLELDQNNQWAKDQLKKLYEEYKLN